MRNKPSTSGWRLEMVQNLLSVQARNKKCYSSRKVSKKDIRGRTYARLAKPNASEMG
jgi:hypothetical protein